MMLCNAMSDDRMHPISTTLLAMNVFIIYWSTKSTSSTKSLIHASIIVESDQ